MLFCGFKPVPGSHISCLWKWFSLFTGKLLLLLPWILPQRTGFFMFIPRGIFATVSSLCCNLYPIDSKTYVSLDNVLEGGQWPSPQLHRIWCIEVPSMVLLNEWRWTQWREVRAEPSNGKDPEQGLLSPDLSYPQSKMTHHPAHSRQLWSDLSSLRRHTCHPWRSKHIGLLYSTNSVEKGNVIFISDWKTPRNPAPRHLYRKPDL